MQKSTSIFQTMGGEMNREIIEIRPQKRPQEQFLSTPADVCIYGGAAGGGKTYAILLECIRHHKNPGFGAVVFRRTTTQINNVGGLWDTACKLFRPIGARMLESPQFSAKFSSGARVVMTHIQHEKNVQDFQGAQIPLVCYDELTHFEKRMFTYMLSRSRTTCGVKPYIRATTNPTPPDDPIGGWIHKWIGWYIDDEGWAIPERSGKIRWFVVIEEDPVFADTAEELKERFPSAIPKTFTFILSRLKDNQVLLQQNPEYLANLLAQPKVDRLRLYGDEEKGGNWLVRPTAGLVINRYWLKIVPAIETIPGAIECRFFDFAGTSPAKAKQKKRDPDYTASLLMRKTGGRFAVLDVTNDRIAPSQQDNWFKNIVAQDARRAAQNGIEYMCRFEIEPGSAAQREAARLIGLVAGVDVAGVPSTKDKLTRIKPFSAQAEAGNVDVLDTVQEAYFAQLHAFPDGAHDDMVDTTSGAFNELCDEFVLRVG